MFVKGISSRVDYAQNIIVLMIVYGLLKHLKHVTSCEY